MTEQHQIIILFLILVILIACTHSMESAILLIATTANMVVIYVNICRETKAREREESSSLVVNEEFDLEPVATEERSMPTVDYQKNKYIDDTLVDASRGGERSKRAIDGFINTTIKQRAHMFDNEFDSMEATDWRVEYDR